MVLVIAGSITILRKSNPGLAHLQIVNKLNYVTEEGGQTNAQQILFILDNFSTCDKSCLISHPFHICRITPNIK